MSARIVVAATGRHGSTVEIAHAVAQVLQGAGAEVDLRRAEEVGDLAPYDSAVLGAPVYDGRWLPEAVKFLVRHRLPLGWKSIALFAVGLPGRDGGPSLARCLQPLLDRFNEIRPVSVGLFAGKLDPRVLSRQEQRRAARTGYPPGDSRDWKQIRAWARGLAPNFLGELHQPPSGLEPFLHVRYPRFDEHR